MREINLSVVTLSLQAIAGMLSSVANITIVVDPKATTFSTDKKMLKMPPLSTIQKEYPNLVDLETYVIGAVIHEAGHIIYTDFDLRIAFKRMFANGEQANMARNLGQVVEDVVIERAQINNMAGAERSLTALWALLYKSYGVHDPFQGDVYARAFRHVFHYGRNSVLRQPWTQALTDSSGEALAAVMEPKTLAAFKSDLSNLYYVQTTEDGFKASLVLLKHLGIEPSLATQVDHEATPQKSDTPDLQLQPSAEQEREASAEQSTDLELTEPGLKSPTPAEGPTEASEGEGTCFTATAVDAAVVAVTASADGVDSTEPPEDAINVGVVPGDGLAVARQPVQITAGMALRQRVQMRSMFATAKLTALLKAQAASHTEFTKSGVIVPSRLWKLRAGNLKVFRKTTEGKELSTAIKILLDRSSSMDDQMNTAIEAAVFLPLAFDQVDGIQSSLDIFPGVSGYSQTLKPFAKRTAVCLDDIAGVTANGGTPMQQAIEEAGADLLNVTADRRLLVVVTDGQPYDMPATRRKVDFLEREGVEIIGIGIGGDTKMAMKVIFKDYCVINSIGELTDELHAIMLQRLISQPLAA